ncbi:TNF receptor-associated factor 6-like [Amblyomma americanum]
MPPASRLYTLVGFSPELDWRPLTFLKPIPANRICSACGLVRKRTALLPCMHVLCESCNAQCCQEGSNLCPVDGNSFEVEDVDLKDFPGDELLRREVKCWNEGNGCQYSTAASGISEHFLLECEHHSVHCPKCSAIVLCRDVRTHLRSASCNPSMLLQSASDGPPGHVDETEFLSSFKGSFERQADEIASYLRPMASGISTYGDRLDEISHGINTLRQELAVSTKQSNEILEKSLLEMATSNEQLKDCFATSSDTVNASSRSVITLERTVRDELRKTQDNLAQIVAAIEEIKAEVKRNGEKTSENVYNVSRSTKLQAAQCLFFVKAVKSLQDTAAKEGWAAYDSEKVYLRGYCMSPGVLAIKNEGPVALHARYILHVGDMDDAVQWPFQHKIRMSIVHPKGGTARVLEYEPPWGVAEKRPKVTSNRPRCSDDFFILEALLSEGYAEDDQLRIMWELVP